MVMILLWLAGDVFKLHYYHSNESPVQLILGTLFTGVIDMIIMLQFWAYSANTAKKVQEEKDAVKKDEAKKTE